MTIEQRIQALDPKKKEVFRIFCIAMGYGCSQMDRRKGFEESFDIAVFDLFDGNQILGSESDDSFVNEVFDAEGMAEHWIGQMLDQLEQLPKQRLRSDANS